MEMMKIDAFAHVLLDGYYGRMLEIAPGIPEQYPFAGIEALHDMDARRKHWNGLTKQVVSYANVNAEDYTGPEEAAVLCREANEELLACVERNRDMLPYFAAMLPMNNVEAAVETVDRASSVEQRIGIQLFTRHLGRNIADPVFRPVLEACAEKSLLVLLHPVLDERKPDNNIVFSWEYELAQAMLQLVEGGIFQTCPDIKIVVHHAGAMVPFFAERISHIMPDREPDFRRFYVDTAILGNPKALELAIDYFGVDHVLYGTDAPFGKMPAGATDEIEAAIDALPVFNEERGLIYGGNLMLLAGLS